MTKKVEKQPAESGFLIHYQMLPKPKQPPFSTWHQWPRLARSLAEAGAIIAKLRNPSLIILVTISPFPQPISWPHHD